MKICWDNLENVRLNKNGNFVKYTEKVKYVLYEKVCIICGEIYLGKKHSLWCSRKCINVNRERSDKTKKRISKSKLGTPSHMKGKTHTKETKEKISKAKTGVPSSKEAVRKRKESWKIKYKNGYIHPNKGKRLTKEHKLKTSNTMKGMNVGEANPNWQGGISYEPYCPIFSDKEFKQMLKDRDNHICLNPGCIKEITKNNPLVGHHVDYDKKNCKPKNFATICNRCNLLANYNREWHTEWYRRILNKRYGYIYK